MKKNIRDLIEVYKGLRTKEHDAEKNLEYCLSTENEMDIIAAIKEYAPTLRALGITMEDMLVELRLAAAVRPTDDYTAPDLN